MQTLQQFCKQSILFLHQICESNAVVTPQNLNVMATKQASKGATQEKSTSSKGGTKSAEKSQKMDSKDSGKSKTAGKH